jgi:hypothetical protein
MRVVATVILVLLVVAMFRQAVHNGRRGITTRGKQLHPNQYDPLGLNQAYVAAEEAALAAGKSRRQAAAAGRAAKKARRQYVQQHPPPPTKSQMRRWAQKDKQRAYGPPVRSGHTVRGKREPRFTRS